MVVCEKKSFRDIVSTPIYLYDQRSISSLFAGSLSIHLDLVIVKDILTKYFVGVETET